MRAAIVGLGRMGDRHLQNLLGMDVETVGLCDLSAERRASAQEKHVVDEGVLYDDFEMMLTNAQPDVVVIATTAPHHADLTVTAAEHKTKYILCEKPMATSIADCKRMIAACEQHGVHLAVNHQMRYMEQYQRPKAILDAEMEQLGSITVLAGNFGMSMNGTHYLEMLRYIAGGPAAEVTAWFSEEISKNPYGDQYQDRAGCLRAVTASGVRYYMDISADHGHGMQVSYTGRQGRITVDELLGDMYVSIRQPEHRTAPTTRYGMPANNTHEKIIPADALAPSKAVLEALLAEDNYPNGTEAMQAVQALVAAYVSHEQGHQPVAVDDSLPADRHFPWA